MPKYSITIKNKIEIMEFKKKTIIWEDNNEPPKDYIGIKSDNKAYEYNHTEKCWKESTTISVINEAV